MITDKTTKQSHTTSQNMCVAAFDSCYRALAEFASAQNGSTFD